MSGYLAVTLEGVPPITIAPMPWVLRPEDEMVIRRVEDNVVITVNGLPILLSPHRVRFEIEPFNDSL